MSVTISLVTRENVIRDTMERVGEILNILVWHEIVNDIVGGEPVAVTYCPPVLHQPGFQADNRRAGCGIWNFRKAVQQQPSDVRQDE